MKHVLRAGVVPVYLVMCLLLGGASAAGYVANMLLQMLAIPLIAWSLMSRRETPLPRASRQLMVLTVLLVAITLIQLVPLPPTIWTQLPGRGEIVAGYQLLGMPLPWLPISVAPYLTIASLLWLLPALAVLLAMLRASAFSTVWLALAVTAVTIVGIALGAIQRSGNQTAYLYDITNYGMATGFFSNGNHMATLLMVTMPFVSALYLVARAESRSPQRSSGLLVILVGAAGILVVGIAINGSLAGLGLSIPVIGASALMVLSRKHRIPRWAPIPLVIFFIAAAALVFSSPLGNNLTTGQARTDPISRYTSFLNTIAAGKDYFPAGSGVGSFSTIYPMYEDSETMTTTYVNHAHSDYLEIFLETGMPGIALLFAFFVWWIIRAFVIWRADDADQFARAATIAAGAILAHSLVDYPLRTAAISALFAMCLALMAEARPAPRQRERHGQSRARHLSAD
jgi:O-antigen ligase